MAPLCDIIWSSKTRQLHSWNLDQEYQSWSHDFILITGIVIENVIFTILSERKLGPKLLGVFAGGRIEEYIPVSTGYSFWDWLHNFLHGFTLIVLSFNKLSKLVNSGKLSLQWSNNH